jgi:SLT domain-containing protein
MAAILRGIRRDLAAIGLIEQRYEDIAMAAALAARAVRA